MGKSNVYEIYVIIVFIYYIYTLVKSLTMKTEGAAIVFVGVIILIVASVNEILYERDILKLGYLLPYGLFIFIFFQSYVLSIRFSKAFSTVEELSENLEKKVEERTHQLAKRTKELNYKNEQIVDSITYSRRIQYSILPRQARIAAYCSSHFVIWKPRDIVGGDFYWFNEVENNFLIAVVDCTGHGVPGALMTMAANSVLNQIIQDHCNNDPATILKLLNKIIRNTLHQDMASTLSDDGLDIGLCYCIRKERRLIYAGAKIPLYYTNNAEVNKVEGDKQSIGYRNSKVDFDYANNEVHVEKDAMFYFATDGYVHQVGEATGLPFTRNKFEDIIRDVTQNPIDEQRVIFENRLKEHQGKETQRDDVTVLGFRI